MAIKKPIKDIKTDSARDAIINLHNKFGKTIGVNTCFGSSNIGQMSGFIAREIVRAIPNAFMRCPIAIYPEVEGPTQVILYDDYQVVLDGCKAKCLKKNMEKAGVVVDLSYAIDEDFKVEKDSTIDFDEAKMKEISQIIISEIREKIINIDKDIALTVEYEIEGNIIETNFFKQLFDLFKDEKVDVTDININNSSLMGYWSEKGTTLAKFKLVSTNLADLSVPESKIEKLLKQNEIKIIKKK